MEHYKYIKNEKCEYFPCHKCANTDDYNCLFCFCPLYALGENCGGNFAYTADGIKDCSDCLIPHKAENYDKIMEKIPLILELARKQE